MSEKKKAEQQAKPEENQGCEFCLCCSCERTCMRCSNCSPMKSDYVPLIGCKDYINMRGLKPLRYIYSGDALTEYKIHIKLPS